MSLEEAVVLARKAVRHATYRDAFSGEPFSLEQIDSNRCVVGVEFVCGWPTDIDRIEVCCEADAEFCCQSDV